MIDIDIHHLSKLLIEAASMGANRANEESGISKKIFTLAEIKKLYGITIANSARMSGLIDWEPLGKGSRTSGVFCRREQFDKFLFERRFSFYK
jgi:hypothetical protein